MTDLQNPIQNDNQTTPVTPSNDDLLGDISIEIPAAPSTQAAEPAESGVSDLGDMLVEQSMDTTQQKAENVTDNVPMSNEIDLGDIAIPAAPETPATEAPATVSSEPTPTKIIEPAEDMLPTEPAMDMIPDAPVVSSEAPVQEAPETLIFDLPTEEIPAATETPEVESPVTETPAIEMPESTPEAEMPVMETPMMEATETVEELPVNEPEPMPESLPVEPMPTLEPLEVALPVEKTDSMIDSLVSNEQQQITAPDAANESMGIDLDALTNDLAATSNPAPVAASVNLPLEGTMAGSTVVHSSAKKKAFAMIAAFLLVAVVGGFVFNTMMPEESNKLLASILGTKNTTVETVETPEEGVVNQGSDVDALIGGNTNTDTTFTEDDTSIEVPSNNDTDDTTEIPENTPTAGSMTTITMPQAQNALELLTQNSKRQLVAAKKIEEESAAQIFYKVFKDSTSLLETLAKSGDISTIPDVEKQIADLQKNLNQGTIILNVASSQHAGS